MLVNRMTLVINVTDERWKPGSSFLNDPKYGLDKYDGQALLEEFSRYLANEMKNLIKERIDVQYRYLRWDPLSPGYLEFKKRHGLSEDIWKATGRLYDSIEAYPFGGTIIVGINPSAHYDNGTNVLFVAKCMEFGTDKMPARPLFAPTVRYMRRHIREYFESFLRDEIYK